MADTRQFMEVFRLTLERLEVRIVFFLDPHRIRLIVVKVEEVEIEYILRMGFADRQTEAFDFDPPV